MKQFLIFPIVLLLANIAFAQAPLNDNCSGAINLTPITAGGVCPTVVYSNLRATDATGTTTSPNPLCFNGQRAFKDVWFKFTTPASTGGNLNFRVTVQGVGTTGSIKNPQVAMYIGGCASGLFSEYCATRLVTTDTNAISLDAGCMRANTEYFIQVGSFLSTDIGGDFTVCIEPIDPVYIMRSVPQTTTACVGTVYDSGGPDNNYGNNQNGYTFNIRPLTTGCIELTIDSFNIETNFDSLVIFDGRTGERLDRITSTSTRSPIVLQLRTDWVQIKFYSDATTTARGFKASWRSLLTCTTPPPTSCAAPDVIPQLPFSQQGATTCNDNLTGVTTSPCTPAANNLFLQGKDHIYKYTSAGAQCIQVSLTGIPVNTATTNFTGPNVGIYLGCPGSPGAQCISTGRLVTTRDSVLALNVTLEIPGDYYFVVSRREACMPYNILIDTIPCLNRLPNAGSCGKALSVNDCSNQNPSDIVLDLSVRGDSSFMTFGTNPSINTGCVSGIGTPLRYNYVFLYFQAKADGKFGFTISPLGADATFDVDFNMYGGIDNFNDICAFTKNNAPIRSSYGVGGSIPNRTQGIADTYINTLGQTITVTDTCEGIGVVAPGLFDGMVRRVNVKKDKYYAIWINDFNGSVGRNGVRLNFNGTDNGVLNNTPLEKFDAGRDTIICAGGSTQLYATGGLGYIWKPSLGLSSDTVARPIASPTVSTAYSVSVQGTCRIFPKIVNVGVYNIKPILDQTVCNGEELFFDAGIAYPLSSNAVWSWSSPTHATLSELSCTTCPNPTFKATNTTGANETHTYIVSLTTPNCVLKDTITITVSAGQVANYQVLTSSKVTRDTNFCIGKTFNLLKAGFDPTATYTWASSPPTVFMDNNPLIDATASAKYYVTVTGGVGGCPAESKDSVIVNVYEPPILTSALKDTTVCKDTKILIGKTAIQSNTTYSWSPSIGLNDANIANPIATAGSSKTTYILSATNPGSCLTRDTVVITGVNLAAKIDTADSLRICRGVPLTLKTTTTPLGLKAKWASNKDFSLPTDSTTSVVVNPTRRTLYHITVSLPGCTRRDSTEVYVDSLPTGTNILPQDTTVCVGTLILLRSPVFEPVLFPGITFKWTPTKGTVTPDSLYNIVLSADSTRTYKRLMQNGVCRVTDSTKVNVNPNPVIVLLPRDTVICDKTSASITLNATSAMLNLKDWKWTGPQGGAISSGDGKTTISVTPSVGVNRYTVTAKLGDCPGSATTTITVKEAPTVTFPDPVICKDASVVLNTSPNATYTYSWSGPNFTSTAAAPSVTPAATSTYAVTVTGSNNCRITNSVEIKVATATLTVTPNTSICAGLPLTLTATGNNNLDIGNYRWSNGGTNPSISPSSAFSGNYSVTYTYGGGKCTLTGSTAVTSIPSFGLRISPDTFRNDRLIEQGTPTTLNAVLTGPYTNPKFSWSINNESLGTTQTINIKPLVDGAYKVSVTSETGCSKDTAVQIYIRYPKYDIPNAFTPNGDTINSYFGIIFNDRFPPSPTEARPRFWKGRIEVLSFQVFSRWGTPIYSEMNTTTLNSATYKGWDGKKGTNDAASDVYVYVIKLRMPDDSVIVETGELNLIR